MDTAQVIVDRRRNGCRRRFTWRTVVYGLLCYNRRTGRRREDADLPFTDWHHPWLLFLSLSIMVMCCADAFMTLMLIERGMVEVNPVMAYLLTQGITEFAVVKLALTGVGIVVLVFLARFQFINRFRSGLFLTFFFSVYSCLVCYQFVNLLQPV
jgi:hypothetical protein